MPPENPQTRASARRARKLTRRTRKLIAVLAGTVVAAGALAAVPALARAQSTPGIFSDNLSPAVAVDPDRSAVELGVAFSPQHNGDVTALQYYQSPARSGVTSATLWSSDGGVLARVNVGPNGTAGWHTLPLDDHIRLRAGEQYVVSYHASRGAYSVTENDLTSSRKQNGFVLRANAGVYQYGQSAFPRHTYKGSNYLVDVVFHKSGGGSSAEPTTPAHPTPSTEPTSANPVPSTHPTTKPTTRPTPKPTAKPTPKPTTTPTPKPTPTTKPTTPPSTPPDAGSTSGPGWTVNAKTVGLAPLGLSCATLPRYSGSADVPAGTVISGKLITSGLNLSAGNITIEKSCIQPTSAGRGMPIISTQDYNTFKIASSKVTVRDSEIDGSKLSKESAAWATGTMGNANLVSNYIHGFGSGIAVMKSGSSLDVRIERNYVTDLIAWGDPATTGNHCDAFTVRDFTAASRADRQLAIVDNRFDANSGNDTGALFIQSYSGRIDNVLVQGNYLEGNGYQMGVNELNDPYSNLRAVNNRFSGTGFGATYVQRGPGWAQWADNYIYSSSGADAKGSVVRQP